jgi:hypothetical protein
MKWSKPSLAKEARRSLCKRCNHRQRSASLGGCCRGRLWHSGYPLVNNAGIARDMLLLRMDERDWDAVLDTNLKALSFASKRATAVSQKA